MHRPLDHLAALLAAAAALAAGVSLPARAQDVSPDATEAAEATRPSTPNEPLPLWEVGAVAIAAWQPAYPGSDKNIGRLRLLPYALYRGSVLRVEGGGVGLRGYRTPRFEWDVSASAAFGSSANRVPARRGMPSIGTLVELGPALRINIGDFADPKRDSRLTRLEIPVRAVFDANDGLAHRGWTFEPRVTHTAWRSGANAVVVSASALFGDRSLNGLYYGVDAPYATSTRPAYAARAGLVATRVGASFRQRIDNTLHLYWFTQLETVRGAANEESPLVRTRQDAGLGVSLIWGIWHSDERGAE